MASVNLTRRGFVAATASATVATVAAVTAAPAYSAVVTPRLYGDGIHDDTDALEHLLRGGTVAVASNRVTAEYDQGTVRLLNGKFRTRRALRMSSDLHLYAPNCTFVVADGPAMPYPILDNAIL